LIDVYRNNLALDAAGCRHIGLPPSGRMTWPRQTTAATAYWVGESTAITDSTQGTGDLNLTAKKLATLTKIPNELFRFSTPSVEQFVREDLMKVMAIEADKTFLESPGSSLRPKGIISYAGITSHTASVTAADGDTFQPEDVGLMIGKVEEKNASFKSWIMRPLMYTAIANRRAGSGFASNDGKGMFLFNMLREVKDPMDRARGTGTLEGYTVAKSTNVSNARTKGSGVNLSYILGGDFSNVIIAGAGVMEFVVAKQGDTMIANDQTWIRAIHLTDSVIAREAGLILCDQLLVS
jgi:HK97 family phage major capsid protein